MREREEIPFWVGRETCSVPEGELRLLSAREVLEAVSEAGKMGGEGREQALCANACLLSRALMRKGKRVFASGEEVLQRLRVEEIVSLSDRWGAFNRECNPSALDGEERIERAKKVWSIRPMRAFNGVCSGCLARFPQKNGRKR